MQIRQEKGTLLLQCFADAQLFHVWQGLACAWLSLFVHGLFVCGVAWCGLACSWRGVAWLGSFVAWRGVAWLMCGVPWHGSACAWHSLAEPVILVTIQDKEWCFYWVSCCVLGVQPPFPFLPPKATAPAEPKFEGGKVVSAVVMPPQAH